MDKDEQIRARAYEIWEHEGRPDGQHDEHWNRAQEQLDIPLTSEDAGGMLGGQALDPAPEVNEGSVAGDDSSVASDDSGVVGTEPTKKPKPRARKQAQQA